MSKQSYLKSSKEFNWCPTIVKPFFMDVTPVSRVNHAVAAVSLKTCVSLHKETDVQDHKLLN